MAGRRWIVGLLVALRALDSGSRAAAAVAPTVHWAPNVTALRPECARRFGWRAPRMPAVLWLNYANGTLCAVGFAFEDRCQLTAVMLQLALREAVRVGISIPPFERLTLDVNDKGCDADLAYAVSDTRCRARLIPDYTFIHWRQVGVPSFTATARDFARAGATPAHRRKCGWAGGFTHRSRKLYVQMARRNGSQLDAVSLSCSQSLRDLTKCRQRGLSQLEQIARWECLVDLPGFGYSGRVPLLLHSGRPLLYVQRNVEVWYEDRREAGALAPWEHYVPVGGRLKDLRARARWVLEENTTAAAQIGARAQAFSRSTLTLRVAVRYLMLQLLATAGAPGLPARKGRFIEYAVRGAVEEEDEIAHAARAQHQELQKHWPAAFGLLRDGSDPPSSLPNRRPVELLNFLKK